MTTRPPRPDMSLLAMCIPAIVRGEPRYQQQHTNDLFHIPGAPSTPMPMWNLDGVSWTDADPPPARHKHWPQLVALMNGPTDEIHRCPCGATWMRGGWLAEREPRVGPDLCRPCGGTHPAAPTRWKRLLHWAGWWP